MGKGGASQSSSKGSTSGSGKGLQAREREKGSGAGPKVSTQSTHQVTQVASGARKSLRQRQ